MTEQQRAREIERLQREIDDLEIQLEQAATLTQAEEIAEEIAEAADHLDRIGKGHEEEERFRMSAEEFKRQWFDTAKSEITREYCERYGIPYYNIGGDVCPKCVSDC